MSQTTLTVRIVIDGLPAAGLDVRLSDPTGTYGVKRNDTGAAVVPAAAAMTDLGGGAYSHTFDDPAADLTYTGWVQYVHDGQTHYAGHTFDGTPADTAAAPPRRPWEAVIPYEDRAVLHTSRWRLHGIATRRGAGNTDGGVLWLKVAREGDAVAAALYKGAGLAASDCVAAGVTDVSGLDGTAESAAEVIFDAVNASGLSGSLRLHRCQADAVCPVQAALCCDEDLDVLYDGIEQLSGYDSVYGLAPFIRQAGEDCLQQVGRLFRTALGGPGDAWFIVSGRRRDPDLRRLRNPDRLRLACACRALELALGRSHAAAGDTAYSALRDHFARRWAEAIAAVELATPDGPATQRFRRLDRG
ncbi:MAG: hypothetical protein GX591_14590 [Planctomycetes bacterium]|nr:hypothetical protein [Planctomycetota bacterium]